ncbi:hypothetical protein F9C07_2902 [Aspergillus flavus]|uniref:Uncharacterized protein n=1 Tax=Aspergillus flavus (strain ATCC 200026 / FGSC A1120 / IAM 13836 / NRRL 3357 / JCM 12722 / SRRC 167) TaxID=332952 RepID=A0A7U2MEJ2_ASPFN|nr:hypothetical protein F9C07_2902 [Aspergillus flavus]
MVVGILQLSELTTYSSSRSSGPYTAGKKSFRRTALFKTTLSNPKAVDTFLIDFLF